MASTATAMENVNVEDNIGEHINRSHRQKHHADDESHWAFIYTIKMKCRFCGEIAEIATAYATIRAEVVLGGTSKCACASSWMYVIIKINML